MSRSLAVARTLCAVIGAAALGLCGPSFGAEPERDDSALARSILASAGANAPLILRILDTWEPYARSLGRAPREWREQTAIALRHASAEDLRTIAEIVPVDGRQNGERYARVQALIGGEAIKAADRKGEVTAKLGSATTDQVFFPITPCRIVDTRFATNASYGGPIAAGTQRNFYFYVADATWRWSTQGGPDAIAYTFCPGTALTAIGGTLGGVPSAAVATVTVVNATAAGNFIVWGGLPLAPGTPFPVTSALNWSAAGQVLANTTVIPYGGRTGGALDFTVRYNGPTGQADVVVDVIGYFLRNDATALDCTVVETAGSNPNLANGTSFVIQTPACPPGYGQTGSACKYNGVAIAGLALVGNYYANYPACLWRNQTGGNVSGTVFYAVSYCCRVPGK